MIDVSQREAFAFSARVLGALFTIHRQRARCAAGQPNRWRLGYGLAAAAGALQYRRHLYGICR